MGELRSLTAVRGKEEAEVGLEGPVLVM